MTDKPQTCAASEGNCPQPALCPLSKVQAGTSVRIKQLNASPEVTTRLREMGFCEEHRIKLLSQNQNIICQVCNMRLGISSRLADAIMVETVDSSLPARKVA